MATLTNTLIPDYMDIDFNTAKNTLQTLLAANPVFKDVDYEGSNITIMIELISYLVALNTYYLNQVAKNQFIPTSNMYETSHMLSELGGYSPMGYRSSSTDLSVSIDLSATILETVSTSATETLILNEWTEIDNSQGITNVLTGRAIKFVTTAPTSGYSLTSLVEAASANHESDPDTYPDANIYTISINAREGYIVRYDYSGSDISDYKIYLPINTYDYDDDLEDTAETIKVYVNDEKWTRLSDWFDDIETVQNAFMFKYDKYGRYYVEFSATRNMPTTIDTISILAIVSSGENGNMSANTVNTPPTTFIELMVKGGNLPLSCYTVTNETASIGGSEPETIDEIKNSAVGTLHSQYRTVTKDDYISFLESRADIIQANVWGEQEEHPEGSVQDYNKVYISLVPSEWDTSTITYVPTSADTTSGIISATGYNSTFTDDVSEYLKPRKMLTVYEYFEVPRLLYFHFRIGLKVKPNYTYTNVMTDVSDKLQYYFNSFNRTFNERISFIDITEYLLDTSIASTSNTFPNIKGLRALIMRDVEIVEYADNVDGYSTTTIYESSAGQYPYYVEDTFTTENHLRTIQLGNNQFPMIHILPTTFSLEV